MRACVADLRRPWLTSRGLKFALRTAYAPRSPLLTVPLRQVAQEEQHAACALLIEEHESLEWAYNEALEQVCRNSPPVSRIATRVWL